MVLRRIPASARPAGVAAAVTACKIYCIIGARVRHTISPHRQSQSVNSRSDIYGHRARIGYTCPPLSAEIFPYEFYKLAPAGVTLVITTLTVIERSQSEVDQAYEMSMRAARELAAAGVDIVFLGGVPVNLSRGSETARDVLRTLAAELGVPVSSSVAAQEKAAKALGCRKVVVAHPYGAKEDARLIGDAERYGCVVLGAMGYGKVINEFGRIPTSAALDMGRALMRAHPQADAIFFPSPHWPVIEAIEPLEREFGVTAMAASQTCVWDALRLARVKDRIEGYGRLLRDF
jgi:maleate isomerase